MISSLFNSNQHLPWSSSEKEDKFFSIILANILLVYLVCAFAIPMLTVPEVTKEAKKALAPHLVKVLIKEQPLPEPKKPEPISPTKPEPLIAESSEPKVAKETPIEKPTPAENTAITGLMQLQDNLANMRDSLDMSAFSGTELTAGATEETAIKRNLIAGKARKNSGGISNTVLAQSSSSTALSGKESVAITSHITDYEEQSTHGSSQFSSGRTNNAIRRIMDQNRGAIFSIYNRALRKNPDLEGKFVFEMLIAPNGTIEEVKLVASGLQDKHLESRLLSRIKLIRFTAADVVPTRVNYSLDFISVS